MIQQPEVSSRILMSDRTRTKAACAARNSEKEISQVYQVAKEGLKSLIKD